MEGKDNNEWIPTLNSNRCGKCKVVGHNARTCPLATKGKEEAQGETGMVSYYTILVINY